MKIKCLDNKGRDTLYTKGKVYDFEIGVGIINENGIIGWKNVASFEEFKRCSSLEWELAEGETSEFEQLYNDAVALRKKVEEMEAEVEKTKKLANSRVLFCEKQSDEFQEENECLKKENLQLKDRVKFFEEEERKKGLILEDQARLLKSMAEEIDRYKKYSSGLVSYIHKNIPKLEDFDCEE